MEAARQSRELARIRTDVPVEFDAEELRYRAGSRERRFAIFNELGFRALAKEYAPTADTIAKTYRIVNTADGVRALAERLRAPAGSRCASCPTADGDARADRRHLVFDRAARRRLRADRPPRRSTTPSACRSTSRSRRCGRFSRTKLARTGTI
jgi:hypothetical protein